MGTGAGAWYDGSIGFKLRRQWNGEWTGGQGLTCHTKGFWNLIWDKCEITWEASGDMTQLCSRIALSDRTFCNEANTLYLDSSMGHHEPHGLLSTCNVDRVTEELNFSILLNFNLFKCKLLYVASGCHIEWHCSGTIIWRMDWRWVVDNLWETKGREPRRHLPRWYVSTTWTQTQAAVMTVGREIREGCRTRRIWLIEHR